MVVQVLVALAALVFVFGELALFLNHRDSPLLRLVALQGYRWCHVLPFQFRKISRLPIQFP